MGGSAGTQMLSAVADQNVRAGGSGVKTIGFISLAGVAVMDGILNITYFRELLSRGMVFEEAIFNGAEQVKELLDGATFKDGIKVTDDKTTKTDERVAA